MNSQKLRLAGKKTFNNFKQVFPILLGVILLIALALSYIPKGAYSAVFTGNALFDPLLGAAIGSIAAGNPITSYIIGGELLGQGISLTAVAAFIIAWVTVGIVQLPAEIMLLGKRFAIARNAVSFVLSIVVALLTALTVGML